jgi:hypothetical protein
MTPQQIIQQYEPLPENLVSLLHDLQGANERHYLTEQDLQFTAGHLQLPFSFAPGVATFYTMFSLTPRGKFIIRVWASHSSPKGKNDLPRGEDASRPPSWGERPASSCRRPSWTSTSTLKA